MKRALVDRIDRELGDNANLPEWQDIMDLVAALEARVEDAERTIVSLADIAKQTKLQLEQAKRERDEARALVDDLRSACEQKQEICDGAVRTNQELVWARAEIERLKSCGQPNGPDPCGACVECLTTEADYYRKERDKARAEVERLRADLDTAVREVSMQRAEIERLGDGAYLTEAQAQCRVLTEEVERLRQCVEDEWDAVAADKILTTAEEYESRILQLLNALAWCGGSTDFCEGGKARVGWERICLPLLRGDKKGGERG